MRVAVLLLLAALTTSGCAAPSATPRADAPPAASARVGLTDFAVTSRPLTVLPGTVRLQVTNAGATVHDLVVTGAAGEWRTPILRPGQVAQLEISAEAGERLELWCSVAGHDAAGMRSVLAVAP
jgi:hypothetical protein